MVTLVAYSLFCLLTLGAPDQNLIAAGATIKIPIANTEVSYSAFLIVGPLISVGLLVYLHIFIGKSLDLRKIGYTNTLPYIFNMPEKTPKLLSHFLFYWLTPLVFITFIWKAWPKPNASTALLFITWVTVTILLVTGLRRSKWPLTNTILQRTNISVLVLFVPVVLLILIIYAGHNYRYLNLPSTNLSHLNLSAVRLKNANLSEANLSYASLNLAALQKANLWRANLKEADLNETQLQSANLIATQLQGATLISAQLQKADLRFAELQNANLVNANLKMANLWRANLQWANL